MFRFPRTRSARLAAEVAEARDIACQAAARIEEIFDRMDRETEAAGLPRPRPGLSLVGRDDRPGAA